MSTIKVLVYKSFEFGGFCTLSSMGFTLGQVWRFGMAQLDVLVGSFGKN